MRNAISAAVASRIGISRAARWATGGCSAASGAKLYAEVFPTRFERGAGLPAVERIAYLAELASVYHSYRPLLFSIAYRMLGTMWDAEDIVADAMGASPALA